MREIALVSGAATLYMRDQHGLAFLPKVLMTADIIVIAELQVQPVFINSGVGDDFREPRFERF